MKKFIFGLCLLACWPLAGLQADLVHCQTISAGAGTTTPGPSFHNLGQTVVGRSSNASTVVWHGAMYCLRVEQCALGDMNCDGDVNGLDIQIYKNVILTGVGTPSELHSASIDIPTFVGLLLN